MNEQSVDIAFNLPEIETNSKLVISWIQKMIDALKEFNAIQTSLASGTGSAGNANNAANNAKQAATEVERLTKKLADLQRQEAEQAAQLKVLISGRNAELKTEAKLALGLVGEYDKLTAKLKEQEKAYRNLAATQGASAAQVEKLRAQTAATREQINKIGKGIGDFSKEVGNYKKGFDGLGASLQGLLREAPSVQSLDQLFLSWSNQLPQFFDEIQKVTGGLKELKDAAAAAGVELAAQQQAQAAAQQVAEAAEETLVSQVESVIASIGASQDQATAIMEQVAAHTAEIETTGAASAATIANTEAVLVNAGATVEQVAAIEAEIIATAGATTASLETTVALEAQTVATVEATAAAAAQPSVLARVGKSLLSMNTLLIAGVLFLTLFGGKIIESLSGETEASKKLKEETEDLEKAKKSEMEATKRQAATEQSAALILYKTATDVNQSLELRKQAIADLQKQYPAYFANLSQEAILAGSAAAAYNELNSALLVKASITANQKELERLSEETNELEKQVKTEKEKLKAIDEKSVNEDAYQGQLTITNRLEGKLLEKNNEREAVAQSILDKQKEISKLLVRPATGKSTETKATKDNKDQNEELKQEIENQRSIAQNEIYSYEIRIGALDLFIEKKRELLKKEGKETIANIEAIDIEEKAITDKINDDKLKEIERISKEQLEIIFNTLNNIELAGKEAGMSDEDILQNKLSYLSQALKAQGLNEEEIKKIEEAITDEQIKQIKARKDAQDAADKDRIAANKKLGQELIKIGRQTEALINTIVSASIERQISELEKKQEAADETYNKDKQNIEDSTQSEKAKAEQIKILDAQNLANKQEIDRQIIEQRKRQAIFDKAAALLEIGITTGVNIVKAFPNPVLMAAAGVLGALQAATVISAKVPEYADGKDITDSHTGAMIWGEAGTELKIDKYGKVEVAHEATVGHTQRGDRIFSNEELKSLASGQTETVSQADYALLIKANAALLEQQKKSDNKNTDKVVAAVFSAAKMNKTNYLQNAARA